jgi:hypothetical protein
MMVSILWQPDDVSAINIILKALEQYPFRCIGILLDCVQESIQSKEQPIMTVEIPEIDIGPLLRGTE